MIPVTGEPGISKNLSSVKQEWCKNFQVHQILNRKGALKNAEQMPEGKRLLDMEVNALKNAIEDKVNRLKVIAFEYKSKMSICELRPALNLFNIYGRILFKNNKVVHIITDC